MSKFTKNKVKFRLLRTKFYTQIQKPKIYSAEKGEKEYSGHLNCRLYLRPGKTKIMFRLHPDVRSDSKFIFKPNKDLNIEALSPQERVLFKDVFRTFFTRVENQKIKITPWRAKKVLKSVPACLMMKDNKTIDVDFANDLSYFVNKAVIFKGRSVAQNRKGILKVTKKTGSYLDSMQEILKQKKNIINRYMKATHKPTFDDLEAERKNTPESSPSTSVIYLPAPTREANIADKEDDVKDPSEVSPAPAENQEKKSEVQKKDVSAENNNENHTSKNNDSAKNDAQTDEDFLKEMDEYFNEELSKAREKLMKDLSKADAAHPTTEENQANENNGPERA